jgi:predicted MFS family arabinose efflux permease
MEKPIREMGTAVGQGRHPLIAAPAQYEGNGAIAATTQAGIGKAQDRVTVYGWKALAGSAIGYSMDGFDLLILGFMLAAISADLNFTAAQAGSLVTWTLMGAVFGGFLFGTLSDQFGRVKVLTWTILIFAAFTGLCAVARGYWDLVAYRTVAESDQDNP